jgi:hypothetical protein
MVGRHINEPDTHAHIAMAGYRVLGFSMHSCHKERTPFHDRKIPLFHQRLLYVDPLVRHIDLGLGLQIPGLRYQLGLFWLFRRFAVISLTNNPLVLTIGYAKPMHFIHRYIERRARKPCVRAGQITAGGKHPPEVPRGPRRVKINQQITDC